METEEAADLIREAIDPEAEIIFGTTINDDLQDEVVVTVIATRRFPWPGKRLFSPYVLF